MDMYKKHIDNFIKSGRNIVNIKTAGEQNIVYRMVHKTILVKYKTNGSLLKFV